MPNTEITNDTVQHMKDLLKRAEEETKEALRDYFNPPRPDMIYEKRRLLTIKEWKQRKRELEIMDFKIFSASLKMPPMSK